MIQVYSSYIPLKRKTKNVYQWLGYINSKLKESKIKK